MRPRFVASLTQYGVGPRFLIRDRDSKLGAGFDAVALACGTEVKKTPVRSPQANAHVERLIGSIRRECLDHVFVLGERDLARRLAEYLTFHNTARPHQGLDQAIPGEIRGPLRGRRPDRPPDCGLVVVGEPVLGGLHHDYRVVA